MASSVAGGTGNGSSRVPRMDLVGNKLLTIQMLARYLFGARRPLARTWSGSNVRARRSKNWLRKALIGLSALIAIDAVKKLPAERTGFFVLSFPLTFAVVFGVVAVRGFASARRIGPALSVRGWRLVAGALVVVAAVGTFGHWAGGVLPLVVSVLCLYKDSVVAKLVRLIWL